MRQADLVGKKLYTPYLPPALSSAPSISHSSRNSATADPTTPLDQTTSTSKAEEHEPGSENPLMEMIRLYTQQDLDQCPTDKWDILDPGLERFDVKGEPRENGESFSRSWGMIYLM